MHHFCIGIKSITVETLKEWKVNIWAYTVTSLSYDVTGYLLIWVPRESKHNEKIDFYSLYDQILWFLHHSRSWYQGDGKKRFLVNWVVRLTLTSAVHVFHVFERCLCPTNIDATIVMSAHFIPHFMASYHLWTCKYWQQCTIMRSKKGLASRHTEKGIEHMAPPNTGPIDDAIWVVLEPKQGTILSWQGLQKGVASFLSFLYLAIHTYTMQSTIHLQSTQEVDAHAPASTYYTTGNNAGTATRRLQTLNNVSQPIDHCTYQPFLTHSILQHSNDMK